MMLFDFPDLGFTSELASAPFALGRSTSPSLSSPSPETIPANHPKPNAYGLASGDPFTLSMLSSRLGSRGTARVGNAGALGRTGPKVLVDGGRCLFIAE